MPKREDWLPYGVNERATALRLIADGVNNFGLTMGLTQAQVDRIVAIAAEYTFAVTVYELNKANIKALRTWRDDVISNKGAMKAASERPMFNNLPMPVGTQRGLIAEIRKYVRLMKVSSGFTSAMGAMMGVTSPNHVKKPLRELGPKIKVTAVGGFKVKIACEMEGMTAIQLEYRRNGEEKFEKIAFLTNLPEIIYVEPRVMGLPESGYMRAIYIHRNKTVGQYSAMMSVTLFGM